MNVNLISLMKANKRVLLVGPPGIAKTGRILAAAAACKRRVVIFRASLCERVDVGGCLVPDIEAGVTRALPLAVMNDLMTTKDDVLLFLDDLGQAPVDVQASWMRVFDEGTLPPNVLIWAATNRPGDKAGVTALCEPLRSRFHVAFRIATPSDTGDDPNGGVPLASWAQEVDQWCEWALDHDAAPEIIAWHRSTQGRTLYAWKPHSDPSVRMPDFRAWQTVLELWNAGLRDLNTLGAAVGRPVAAEFLAFAALADKLPSPEQVWMDPEGAQVPDEPAALYLVAAFLGQACESKHGRALVKYLQRMPRIYGALLARDAFRKLGAKLSGTREWAQWYTQNQDIFAVGTSS